MPFSIVQTLSAGGRKELSAVPDKWLDKSIHGDILLWPNVKSSTEQAKLLRDENSTPGKSWLKYNCRIKRKNMPSYAQAAMVIDEMSGCSSSDASVIPRKRKKINKTAPANFQNMLNMPAVEPSPQIIIAPHHTPPPHSITLQPTAASANNQNSLIVKSAMTSPRSQSCSKNTSKKKLPANVTTPAAHPPKPLSQNQDECSASQPSTTATADPGTPLQPIVLQTAPNFNQPIFEFDPNSINFPETLTLVGDTQSASENSIRQCVDYLKQLIDMQRASDAMIDARISTLEKRLAHQSTQIEFIMDAIKCCIGQDRAGEAGQSFNFEIIDDSRRLEDLEKNLSNESYRSDLMKWLRVNVNGDCADDRMTCVLDMIMTKKFQTQCTWTGSSCKGPKVPVMVHQKLLKVFAEIGTTETEIVTQHKLVKFFMKKLKNAGKRVLYGGMRRGSRHTVRKRGNQGKGLNNTEEQAAILNADDILDVTGIQDTNAIQVHQSTIATENFEVNEPSEITDKVLMAANVSVTENDMDLEHSNDEENSDDSSDESTALDKNDSSNDDNLDDNSLDTFE